MLDGLEAYNISPINTEFDTKGRLEIKLEKFESFTVVLKVSRGIDR